VIWVVIGVAIVLVGLVFFAASRRRTPDGVTTFQRQIDALSPEARRPVVKRLKDVERPPGPATPPGPPRSSLADPGLAGPVSSGARPDRLEDDDDDGDGDTGDDGDGDTGDDDTGVTAVSDGAPSDQRDDPGSDARGQDDPSNHSGPTTANPGIVDPGLDAVRRRDERPDGGVDGA